MAAHVLQWRALHRVAAVHQWPAAPALALANRSAVLLPRVVHRCMWYCTRSRAPRCAPWHYRVAIAGRTNLSLIVFRCHSIIRARAYLAA